MPDDHKPRMQLSAGFVLVFTCDECGETAQMTLPSGEIKHSTLFDPETGASEESDNA